MSKKGHKPANRDINKYEMNKNNNFNNNKPKNNITNKVKEDKSSLNDNIEKKEYDKKKIELKETTSIDLPKLSDDIVDIKFLDENKNNEIKTYEFPNKDDENTINDNETNNIENIKPSSKKTPFYMGYYERLICYISAFIILLFFAIYFSLSSIKYEKEKLVTYTEKSDINYQVCLKSNSFYDQKCLDKGTGVYVASLIDYIPISFIYDFEIENNADVDFTYSIIGKLSIANETGQQPFLEKEYILANNKKVSMKNDNKYQIKEDVVIDYNQYNDLANSFKTSYGLNTVSNLKVYLKIDKKNKDDTFTFSDSKDISIVIPLSSKEVDIVPVYDNINEKDEVFSTGGFSLVNVTNISVSIVLAILALYFLAQIIKLVLLTLPKKNEFDKYVEKIIKEYDRLIAETATAPDLTELNIIKIKKFSELLDIRDNLKLPIMYYVVVPHQKCYFYIKYKGDIYINTIKEVDLKK